MYIDILYEEFFVLNIVLSNNNKNQPDECDMMNYKTLVQKTDTQLKIYTFF